MPFSLSSRLFRRFGGGRRSRLRVSADGDGEGEASGVGVGDDCAAAGDTNETAGEGLHQRDVTAAIAITATKTIIASSTMRRRPENQRCAGSGKVMLKRATFEG